MSVHLVAAAPCAVSLQMPPAFKRKLQLSLALLLHSLHSAGLAHLDFTPENILVHSLLLGCVDNYTTSSSSSSSNNNKGASEGFPLQLRACDFAKATPLFNWSNLRLPASLLARYHRRSSLASCSSQAAAAAAATAPAAAAAADAEEPEELPPFISCEPTIAKGPYMPPETWKVLRILRSLGSATAFISLSLCLCVCIFVCLCRRLSVSFCGYVFVYLRVFVSLFLCL